MKRIYLITNDAKDPEMAVTNRVMADLSQKGFACTQATLSALRQKTEDGINVAEEIPADTLLCMVLGGDGTMLEAAHVPGDRALPLLGVNLGNIGYLTEIEEDDIAHAIDKITAGDYTIEARMMLTGEIFRNGEKIAETRPLCALNDIVIARYGSIRMIALSIDVNGSPLCEYHADGVILATPTGSTSYNMSAGGPVVEPVAEMILLTPVSPHARSPRSIVLSPADEVTVTITSVHAKERYEAEVSFDGVHTRKLEIGDRIKITRADRKTHIVRLSSASFLDVLHRKLG